MDYLIVHLIYCYIYQVSYIRTAYVGNISSIILCVLYFGSVRYEKKQIVTCRAWEYEQNKIQSALENVINDLESLKDINMKKEQTIRKRKYVRII